jgi:hypothetical protein
MIPIHVALVAYKADDKSVNTSTILRVAAALQIQLTRDFTPLWGIPAVVSPFLSLKEVPPACIPLLVVEPGSLQPRGHAFHITNNGQAIGLVEAGEGWSFPASHELLEIVCDPQGKTKVMGESIADYADANEFAPGAEDYPRPQGQVAYLLEICDPCQSSHYTVNGFQLSDFVTPQYYAPGATQGGRYSFTGKITNPQQVLPGGYITWYTSITAAPIWQAIRDTLGNLSVGPMPVPVSAYSRHQLDYFNDYLSGLEAALAPGLPAANAEQIAKESAARYGTELSKEVDDILEGYKINREPPAISLAAFVKILDKLANNNDYYATFEQNPKSLADEPDVKTLIPSGFQYDKFPTQKRFQDVYRRLKTLSDRQAGLRVPRDAAITAMQGTTIWGGPPPPPPPKP